MRKIPTVFRRDPEDMKHVTTQVNPECEWVFAGEGIATRKYDGTCFAKLETFGWAARREVKPGKSRPPGFIEVGYDETTGKAVGWEPANQSPFAKMWREATEGRHDLPYGTYELCGPKINGNPEGLSSHTLIRHADAEPFGLANNPAGRDPVDIVELVKAVGRDGWEGIVWHHPDGRMAKLKARDLRAAPVPYPAATDPSDGGGGRG